MSVEFCDTNILVYAYDSLAGAKQDRAQDLTRRLWETGSGTLSSQVLQEFYVALRGKLRDRIDALSAAQLVAEYSRWHVVEPGKGHVLRAIDASQRWQISSWDAMILTAAQHAGATTLWTEDLSHGQDYGGVVVRDPFAGG